MDRHIALKFKLGMFFFALIVPNLFLWKRLLPQNFHITQSYQPSQPPLSNRNMSIAVARLTEEHQQWKHHHPRDFSAKPVSNLDGSLNYLFWECSIPGPEDTPWEGGQYYLILEFSSNYPDSPPRVRFVPEIFHPNVFPSGTVALSFLEEGKGWYPQITVRDILLGVQRLLTEPNIDNPANSEAYMIYTEDFAEYEEILRNQAAEFSLEYEEEEEED